MALFLYAIYSCFVGTKPSLLALRQSIQSSAGMTPPRIVAKKKLSLLSDILLREFYPDGLVRKGTDDETTHVAKSPLIHVDLLVIREEFPIASPK